MTKTIEADTAIVLELDLARRIFNLGDDQRDGLLELVTKAERGRVKYGQLNLATDERDFVLEALQESQDQNWYLAAEIVRLKRHIAEIESQTDSQWRSLRRQAEADVAAAPVMISDLRDHNIECAAAGFAEPASTCSAGCPVAISVPEVRR